MRHNNVYKDFFISFIRKCNDCLFLIKNPECVNCKIEENTSFCFSCSFHNEHICKIHQSYIREVCWFTWQNKQDSCISYYTNIVYDNFSIIPLSQDLEGHLIFLEKKVILSKSKMELIL